jgi:hypothetical protein
LRNQPYGQGLLNGWKMNKDESIMPDPPEVPLFPDFIEEKRKTPSNHGGSKVKPKEKEKIDQEPV